MTSRRRLPPISAGAISSNPVILNTPKIITDLPESRENMWNRQDIQVNEYLAFVYRDGEIIDDNGVTRKFIDTTNPIQGRHIYNLIRENKFTRTLEVGLAMGASAVWICQAHADNELNGKHIAIDPNQSTLYGNMGRTLIKRCGLKNFMSIMETASYRALPKLLEDVLSGKAQRFQFIYIDGWHTFDYTLVDFFFSDLLLEINGVIVLDDIKHKSVQKFFKYVSTNYPNYRIVQKTPCYHTGDVKNSSQATFIKTGPDTRVWNAHVNF